ITNVSTANLPTTPGILSGAEATAAIEAFAADAKRKNKEEKAKRGGGNENYRRIAKAYQASMKAFKEKLIEKGLSATQASAFKSQAVKNGSISSVAGAAQAAVDKKKADQRIADKMAAIDAADEARWAEAQAVIAEREKIAEAEKQKMLDDFRAGEQQVYEQNLSDIARTPENSLKPKSGWEKLALWVSGGFDAAQGVENTVNAASVVARPLEGGYVGVSAPRSIRDMFGLLGTRYKPSTISLSSTGSSLIKSSAKNGAVAFNFGVSLLTNIYDYHWGEDKDTGVVSQEFGVSAIVDTVVATAVGIAAAGVVAGVVAFLVGVGVLAATLSTPVLVGIAIATPVVAIGIGLGVDLGLEWPDKIKDAVNNRIDEWQGEPND
ncbi:MAG: hypothetical protein MUO77_08285, partial [Anaerolineales bacterium]|nr:hypothetical protein [Anaerolineales bacterium]